MAGKINDHKEKGNDSERDGNQQITRSNKIPRKNNSLATENNIRQLPTAVITELRHYEFNIMELTIFQMR